tara:strand:+ start:108 stop:218 length:111 start_codon:yes stop_codon:yes gene_type:complete
MFNSQIKEAVPTMEVECGVHTLSEKMNNLTLLSYFI